MLRVNLPPLTKVLLAFSAVASVVVFVVRYSAYIALTKATPDKHIDLASIYVSYLTIVPGVSIVFPWTFLTAAFIEQNLFALLIHLGTLYYAARYCERIWGSVELARFLALVTIVPNLVTFILYILAFVFTGNTDYEFVTIFGGVAIQSAFLVAFKQLVPEHTVVLFRGIVKIRVKHFPALFLLINTIFGILGARINAVFTWTGFFTSWVYLRFYRQAPLQATAEAYAGLPPPVTSNGIAVTGTTGATRPIRGDASDTFSLANFFPDALAPFIGKISDATFAFFVNLRLCTPFSAEDIEASNIGNGQFRQRFVAPLPGSVRAEAERRRALALKALDQRLSQGKKESTGLGETNFVPEENQN
ncbi:eukaryotic integral membrane protein-domain-containing protein [Lipomyces japonicus]|uniref:eukaryotic integral membrane protein-domain-containing protein n=1 Tax=Lipomyces japonicus TaxID=56871 RepID=UPI0034CD9E95